MKFQRILDAGCGTGMSAVPLVSAWESAEIIGEDLSKEMLEKVRERFLCLGRKMSIFAFI